MHRRDVRLTFLALADAVGAGLGEQQRLVSGNVLQPREVRAQLGLAVQIHVEGEDVEEREIEEFRRRKVDVREQAVGRGRLALFVQDAEITFDALPAVPAHDTGWNFVAQREGQDRGMVAQLGHLLDDLVADPPAERAVVEERDVLRPGQPDHHAQIVTRRLVEQIAARRRVQTDRIDAEARHQAEVFGDLGYRRELIAGGIGRERPVRDALDEEPRLAEAQKFPVCRDPGCRRLRRGPADLGMCLNRCAHNR